MALPKRHWNDSLQDCTGAMCGMVKAVRFSICTAASFVESANKNPDWYCVQCLWKARLALAKKSAPKPDAVVWPKPRPISEAPINACILGWVPATDECRAGWELLHYSVADTEWRDIAGVTHEPTHFLPLPPEVQTP